MITAVGAGMTADDEHGSVAFVEEMLFGRRYRATEKIGSGGMADVYKAVDEVLGRTVAVKVMHKRYAGDPSFAARFRQEAQAAANLQSPYIVNMYDWGQDGDTYYIVMEYVRGTDLKTIIEQRGSARLAQGGRDRRPGLLGAERRARIRRHPPRHQAAQHHGDARRLGEGHGLRHRARRQQHA
jgi:eukaryotic-like serine/threonine-protein kinase